MLKRSVLLLTTLLAVAIAPSTALAKPGDVTATQAYIQANYTLLREANTKLTQGEAALTHLLHQLRGQCPKVVAESPQDHNSEQLSDEVIGAMTIAAFHPVGKSILAFDRTVQALHWSDPRLTRKVKAYATKLTTLSKLAMPDLCADLKAWATSGFQTLSAGTLRFDRLYGAVEVGIGEVATRQLVPFELPAEKATLRRVDQIEARLLDAEARAVETWSQILDALGLNP
jgi:hypothetical protein